MDVDHQSIYFLLVTKCDIVAEKVGVETGKYVVKKGIIS